MHQIKENLENSVHTKKDLHSVQVCRENWKGSKVCHRRKKFENHCSRESLRGTPVYLLQHTLCCSTAVENHYSKASKGQSKSLERILLGHSIIFQQILRYPNTMISWIFFISAYVINFKISKHHDLLDFFHICICDSHQKMICIVFKILKKSFTVLEILPFKVLHFCH